jgi:hypothetical protein
MFSVSGFALSYAADIVIVMIVYDLRLLLAQFCYIIFSESKLLYDWRFIANQFIFALSLLRLTTRNFFSQVNPCCHSPYVTSSLTRRWVYRLQLLLVLANAVILESESRGTRDRILLSQIRDSPKPGGPGRRIYIPQERSGPVTPALAMKTRREPHKKHCFQELAYLFIAGETYLSSRYQAVAVFVRCHITILRMDLREVGCEGLECHWLDQGVV